MIETDAKLPEFSMADVILDGKRYKFLARFNPVSQQIEVKNNTGTSIYNLAKKHGINIRFPSQNETYVYTHYIDEHKNKSSGYFLLDSNYKNSNLMKRTTSEFVKAKKKAHGYDFSKPAYFKETTSYFYKNKNNGLVEISTKKKSIKKQYPKNSKKIIDFIKDNKLKDEKESDIIRLATFLGSLEDETTRQRRSIISVNKQS